MITEKQTLARERNWTKYRLLGVTIPTKRLTKAELEMVNNIKKGLKTLIENFDAESTKLGLNVRKKCWCRKPIKDHEEFCKEHE